MLQFITSIVQLTALPGKVDDILSTILPSTFQFHPGEAFQQQAMNEDVTATNFLQKDQIGGVVEETRVFPMKRNDRSAKI